MAACFRAGGGLGAEQLARRGAHHNARRALLALGEHAACNRSSSELCAVAHAHISRRRAAPALAHWVARTRCAARLAAAAIAGDRRCKARALALAQAQP